MNLFIKKIVREYQKISINMVKLKNLPLLAIRLVLAYGFFIPAINKWQNINSIVQWFGELGIPAPQVSAYLSASTEAAGVIFLTLGFGIRLISIPLMINMIVAVVTVHWANGFEAGNNGFEIPLYYFIMLFALLVYGGGKYSIDLLIKKYMQRIKSKHFY